MSNTRQIDPELNGAYGPKLDGFIPNPTDDPKADRGTQIFDGIILPNTTITVPIPGDSFYFPALSGLIYCAPVGKLGKQSQNPYYAGTGLRVDRRNWFKALELRNPSETDSLFYNLVAGFDAYIDNRLTYPNAQFKQISVQTYSVYRAGATEVTIDDMSGTVITDDNGNEWYAVNRQLIEFFNADEEHYFFLLNTARTKDCGMAQPLTSAAFPVSGNFKAVQGASSAGGEQVNGIIAEIYNCLPKLI